MTCYYTSRHFQDLRFLFMRGLIEHEKQQRTRHYLKSASECTSRAVVSLELSEDPVKTVKQARQLEGIGGETCAKLTKLEKERNFSNLKPAGGKFVSSAGAILVALLEASDDELMRGHSQDRPVLIPEDHVRRRASNLSEEAFLEQDHLGFCKAWWRLEVLIKRGLVRRRTYKKQPVLQLLPLGRDIANRLRGDVGRTTIPMPAPVMPRVPALHTDRPTTSVGQDMSTLPWNIQGDLSVRHDDALYTNDNGSDGIVLLVDTQEWGGDRVGLGDVSSFFQHLSLMKRKQCGFQTGPTQTELYNHRRWLKLCRLLDQAKIRYKTKKLAVGDYSWFWRVDGVERTLPCLVERKRADDVAKTLKDRRFWSQVNKMVAWKKDYQLRGIDCYLHYILEREPEDYVVQCEDGCQGVGRCGYPTLTQVKLAIEDLKKHPDLQVKMTDSIEMTVILLSSLTSELMEWARKGDFDNLIAQEMAGNNRQTDENTSRSNKNASDTSINLNTHTIDVIDDDDDIETACKVGVKKHKGKLEGIRTEQRFDNLLETDDDAELALAMRNSTKSRHRSDTVQTGPSSLSDSIYNKVRGDRNSRSAGMTEDLDRSNGNYLSDRELERDLAIAIENSKRDTGHDTSVETGYSSISDEDNTPMPLMQYHCSLSKSVTCTAQSPKKRDINTTGYRPKINRTKDYTAKSPSVSDSINTGYACAGQRNLTHLVESKITEYNNNSYSEKSNSGKLPKHKDQTSWLSSLNSERNSETDLDNKRTIRKHRSPFSDLDGSTLSSTSSQHLSAAINSKRIGNKKEKVPVKKKKVFAFNPDEKFLERNVISKDFGVNNENNATKSKQGVSDLASSGCLEKNFENCNSDEDLFDNEISCDINSPNTRSIKKLEDCNSSGFEQDSSSDSLPDLLIVSPERNTDLHEKNTHLKATKQLKSGSEKSRDIRNSRDTGKSSSKHSEITLIDSDDEIDSIVTEDKHNVKRTENRYQIVTDEDLEEKIDMILCVLPQLDREKCFWLLHRFLGKTDQCIEHVLKEESKQTQGVVIDLDD